MELNSTQRHYNRPQRQILTNWFQQAASLMEPGRRFRDCVQLEGAFLKWVGGQADLSQYANIHVIGAGKAAEGVAKAVSDLLGERITGGIVLAPDPEEGYGNIRMLPADHPVPGDRSVASTREMLDYCEGITPRDLVLCIITGGASAMLCAPIEGLNLAQKQDIHRKLLVSGASIHEMNVVRTHLSRVKGGGLLQYLNGARILNLLISDVPGDDPSVIGSGPAQPRRSTAADALALLNHYVPDHGLPPAVFESGRDARFAEQGKDTHVDTIWVATPSENARLISELAQKQGYRSEVATEAYRGPVDQVAGIMLDAIQESLQSGSHPNGHVLIYYGESEVEVANGGKGGRNQHLALLLASEMEGKIPEGRQVTILSVGTDGVDGNTPNAGAICTESTTLVARKLGFDPGAYVGDFDSGTFFTKLDDIFRTGPTGNNLMDLQIILIN